MRSNPSKTDTSKLVRCSVCGTVNYDQGGEIVCHRCRSSIPRNPTISTARAWALLITAIVLYIPANIYPLLLNQYMGFKDENTVIGGIIFLWEQGSYSIAVIVFVASVVVPILKFIVLLYLLIKARQLQYKRNVANQYRLFYVTKVIGPWSMIDIFVVATLTGLVQLSTVKVIAGPGATAYVLMVLFTTLSALSIDTRLFETRRDDGAARETGD